MTEQIFNLDTTDRLIKVGFKIKQAVFTNPTPNPIYINYSGLIPSVSKFELIVQANSVVTTPPLYIDQIYAHQDNLDLSRKAFVTIYDTAILPAGNIPFIARQNVASLSNYPITINPTGLVTVQLPDIFISNFKNIYFLINKSFASGIVVRLDGKGFNEGYKFINALSSADGIFTFTPTVINQNHNFQIIHYAQSGVPSAITIDAIQTDDLIQISSAPPDMNGYTFVNSAVFVFTEYFFAKPPGFYFALEVGDVGGALVNVTNLLVRLLVGNSHYIVNQNFATVIPAVAAGVNIPYLIPPTFVPITNPALCTLTIQDISGTLNNPNLFRFGFWNLDG